MDTEGERAPLSVESFVQTPDSTQEFQDYYQNKILQMRQQMHGSFSCSGPKRSARQPTLRQERGRERGGESDSSAAASKQQSKSIGQGAWHHALVPDAHGRYTTWKHDMQTVWAHR
eukprot:2702615-Rhodomonas_salina.2